VEEAVEPIVPADAQTGRRVAGGSLTPRLSQNRA
jgi:hypothetical protein